MKRPGFLFGLAIGSFLGGLAVNLPAQIIDGVLSAADGYGSPLATQTINTGFGDSIYSAPGPDANGSELDALYGKIVGGNLYLFVAGNFENNGNHVDVFVDSGQAGGQSILNIPGGWIASAMNGSAFGPGFAPNYLLDVNDYFGTLYADRYVLSPGGSVNAYLGNLALTAGIGGSPDFGGSGIAIGFNNSNVGGVNGNTGTPADPAAADAVNTGLELAIPLTEFGNPAASVEVLVVLNGFNDNYVSNQMLPGLPVGTGNLDNNGVFDVSSVRNEYVTIPVPEPAVSLLLGFSGLAAWSAIRRRMMPAKTMGEVVR
jgi:hypothetical protein